jgi:hypothetical protein
LDTQPNGAAGTIYYSLKFTNLSGHACTLRGYPKVAGLSIGGTQLGGPAAKSTVTPVKTVTLAAGKTAIATLGIVEVGNFPVASCHPTIGAGLQVRSPNQTIARTIPFPFAACAKPGAVYLNVQAVRP